MKRRHVLALAAVPWLAGCASMAFEAAGQMLDARTRRPLSGDDWLERLKAAQYLLLGELHDNAAQHRQRGEWLRQLPAGTPVVLEHLASGTRLQPQVVDDDGLLTRLMGLGFDAKGWRWPLHAPLLQAAVRSGQPLIGGNLPREAARRAAREGTSALPVELLAMVDAAPLKPSAQAALDADLRAGHCQQLPEPRLPGMRAAQRGRDAAMASALQSARRSSPTGCAVLLCGNGHVRRDYGVAQLLAQSEPAARTVSVGLVEQWPEDADQAFDLVWIGPRASREDPCQHLNMTPRI